MDNISNAILAKLNEIHRELKSAKKDLLNVEEVAEMLGVSRNHVYKLTHLRRIPHYKPEGRIVYFDRAEINSWLKRNRVSSDNEADATAILNDYMTH